MAFSPLAANVKRLILLSGHTCTVEPFDATQGTEGYDDSAQPLYGTPRTASCRIAQVQRAELRPEGDVHGSWGTSILFPADDPVTDLDRITLDDERGPIVVEVRLLCDLNGQLVYKEAVI